MRGGGGGHGLSQKQTRYFEARLLAGINNRALNVDPQA